MAARAFALGDQAVWWDEALAVWAVRKPLLATTLWTAGDVHPPLYFWSLWFWRRLVGDGEFALRYLTVLYGVLSVAVAASLGRRAGGRMAAAVALAAVALSRFEVWWSTELRMYMLGGLLLAIAAYAGLRWLAARSEGVARRWIAGYVLSSLGALYTVYLAGVGVAAIACGVSVALMVSRDGDEPGTARRRLLAWLAAQALVLGLTLPWLAVAVPRMQSWTSIRGAPASIGFVSRLWATLVATGVSVDIDAQAALTALFWVCAFAAPGLLIAVHRARRRAPGVATRRARTVAPAAVLAPFLLVPPIAVWLATQPRSLFYSPTVEARYLLPFALPVYALAAALMAAVMRRQALVGVVLGVAAMAVICLSLPGFYESRRLRDELQSMVLAIGSQAEPGDVVVLVSGNRYPVFLYYYDRLLGSETHMAAQSGSTMGASLTDGPSTSPGHRPPVVEFPDRGSTTVGDGDTLDELGDTVSGFDRVWLAEVDSHLQDPADLVEAWLSDRLPRLSSESFGANALHLFGAEDRRPQVTAASVDWPWVVEPAPPWAPGWLPAVAMPARRLFPGDELNVTLWRSEHAEDSGPAELAVVRAEAPGGVARRIDLAPDGVIAGTRYRGSALVDDRWPSGRYDVELWSGGDRARLGSVAVGGTTPLGGPFEAVDADFGVARLVAATMPDTARPGQVVPVDLQWAQPDGVGTLAPTASDAVVFAHLIGPPRAVSGDVVWGVGDGPPSSGTWAGQGAAAIDRHLIVVDPSAPAGEYEVEIGLYDPASGQRFAVSGADADRRSRRVVIGTVTVER